MMGRLNPAQKRFPLIKLAKKLKVKEEEVYTKKHQPFPLIKLAKKLKDAGMIQHYIELLSFH